MLFLSDGANLSAVLLLPVPLRAARSVSATLKSCGYASEETVRKLSIVLKSAGSLQVSSEGEESGGQCGVLQGEVRGEEERERRITDLSTKLANRAPSSSRSRPSQDLLDVRAALRSPLFRRALRRRPRRKRGKNLGHRNGKYLVVGVPACSKADHAQARTKSGADSLPKAH